MPVDNTFISLQCLKYFSLSGWRCWYDCVQISGPFQRSLDDGYCGVDSCLSNQWDFILTHLFCHVGVPWLCSPEVLCSDLTSDGASVVGQMISWRFPLHLTPLMSSEVEILEMHMGVDGRRLTSEEMSSHNYGMIFTKSHVVVEIPIGAPGGYYKVGFSTDLSFP